MQSIEFQDAVDQVLEKDSRYDANAYHFLHSVLTSTAGDSVEEFSDENRHVGGAELLESFRERVLEDFGPMAMTVMEEWGLGACEDIGEMVFNLIEAGAFSKSEHDRKEDFVGLYTFVEAFVQPFKPRARRGVTDGGAPRDGVSSRTSAQQ